MPRGFRDMMKRELEQKQHSNLTNMSDHDIQQESYNLAVQRNKNLSAFTKEQQARQTELFDESSNRAFERVHGQRPTTRSRPSILQQQSTPQEPIQQQQPTELETQAGTVYKFTHLINPTKKTRSK